MKVPWLFLIFILLAGCTPVPTFLLPPPVISYEEFIKLPRKWEAPVLYVRLPADVKEEDLSIEYAVALCKEFAIRIYDASDGQIYVPRFIICNPSLLKERDDGMCNLFTPPSLLYRNEAYVGNSPMLHPGRFYCEIPRNAGEINECAAVMLHEWLHAFMGLGDEYKHAGEIGNTVTTACPKNYDKSCVMASSRSKRELCRPENHNPDTDQGKESCWSKISRLLFENRLAYVRIPEKAIDGPLNPPTPKIEVRLK